MWPVCYIWGILTIDACHRGHMIVEKRSSATPTGYVLTVAHQLIDIAWPIEQLRQCDDTTDLYVLGMGGKG